MKVIDTENLTQDWKNTKIFGGEYGGFQRFDIYRHPIAKKLDALQRAQFWMPEEIGLHNDRHNFDKLSKDHRTAFRINLLFQTLADSVQSRGIEETLSSTCTDPSWEPLFRTWAYFEVIHSLSYSHIVRSMYNDSTEFFDSIAQYPEIAHRFDKEAAVYNAGHDTNILVSPPKEQDYFELLVRILALEALKFFVSFLVTYAISEQNKQALQGCCRIIKLIQNDENIHTSMSSNIIRIAMKDPSEIAMKEIINPEQTIRAIFEEVVHDEMEWWRYLKPYVKDIGMLNDGAVENFIKYRADKACKMAGFEELYNVEKNELTSWFEAFSNINTTAVAAQEAEQLSYNVGQLVNDL